MKFKRKIFPDKKAKLIYSLFEKKSSTLVWRPSHLRLSRPLRMWSSSKLKKG
jgi:hypothetical protein